VKRKFKTDSILLAVIISSGHLFAQEADYYLGRAQYSFIAYNQNYFKFPVFDSSFKKFYNSIDSVIGFGKGKIQIVHLGGSHLQADIYTHVVRQHLQELSPDMNGGRGLIFPFKMAHLYNPSNFEVRYTGLWDYCLSTEHDKTCRLGITGISVTTTDTLANIVILPNKESTVHYTFNQVRIFHEPTKYQLYVASNDSLIAGVYDSAQGLSVFLLGTLSDTLKPIIINKKSTDSFTLQGISLDTDSPGLVYNAIGVNGAMLSSYLRCELYGKHLHDLDPDLIIFSIGTNDGYVRKFDQEKYRNEYAQLLEATKKAAPDAAILVTVPNDSYLYRRYVNTNTEKMREVIFNLAEKYHCAVWDFYTIMGGLNSSQAWRSADLMQHDKVHFNRAGYELKGELFFSAILKGWENQMHEDELVSGLTKIRAEDE
jgi:lysophospholipase L1-like esterase